MSGSKRTTQNPSTAKKKAATQQAAPKTQETGTTPEAGVAAAPEHQQAAPMVMTAAPKETFSGDMPMDQPSDIVMPGLSEPYVPQPEEVELVEKPLSNDYAAQLAFNEEEIIIRVEPSSEENAPKFVPSKVNGKSIWIPVGQHVKVKRKFVEVLLRSKPVSINTKHEDTNVALPENRIERHPRQRYPLSVVHDPNPKGMEWFQRLTWER